MEVFVWVRAAFDVYRERFAFTIMCSWEYVFFFRMAFNKNNTRISTAIYYFTLPVPNQGNFRGNFVR